MRFFLTVVMMLMCGLGGCGVEEFVRRNDDRYAKPGAMDSPLTGIYKTYQYSLLDRHRVSHQWLESGCQYSAYERPSETKGKRTLFYDVLDVYEDGGATKQRGSGKHFNNFVRSVISEEKFYTDVHGQRQSFPSKETGFRPLCYEYWWTTSHSLSLRLHKLTLAEFETMFSERYPEGKWSSRVLNGREWRVQETPIDKLRPRQGVGGPYHTWVTSIGDTGYVIALEMTASQDSLTFPQAHAAIEDVYRHLIASVRIEPLRNQSGR